MKGKRFPEFVVGEVFIYPPAEVEANMIEASATLTGDRNLLHVDEEFASASFFKGRIAHGMLTASLALAHLGDDTFNGTALALTSAQWNFLSAARIGDRLETEARVLRKEPREEGKKGGRVTFALEARNQHGERVLSGEVLVPDKD